MPRAKAKPKAKAASGQTKQWRVKGEAEAPAEQGDEATELPRSRIREARYTGLVTEWRGYMGWIQPLGKVEHAQAAKHWGLIYVNQRDVVAVDGTFPRMKEGKIVDFYVYSDGDGLGAEEVRGLSPLRVTLSHTEAKLLLKKGESPHWSEYLTDSEYYPAIARELGVLVRKYTWSHPFVTLELWGSKQDVASAALKLSSAGGGSDQNHRRLQLLLPEDQIPQVENLPGNPKVSTHAIVPRPVPCRSLTLEAPEEECKEAVIAFLQAMEGK
eukprot:gb/GFBE01043087.1/.p1 GENE.gb/GFBE01043087.1/~~gb/GFBE01043087.1/.p1  ORF type:complete len:270 (+),score=51.96 gb/GFBE01043087.1/:1-810(+)